MVVLPFTKKARARDLTLEEITPLLAMRGVPDNFWELPYAVGFIIGYARGVSTEVTEGKASDGFVSDVVTSVIAGLRGSIESAVPVARQFATWINNPKFTEGHNNGNFFAFFMRGNPAADATALAAEAFKLARERAPVFEGLREKTNERGRAAMILCDVLFFEKLNESPSSAQPQKEVAGPVAGDSSEPRSSYQNCTPEAPSFPLAHGTIWLEQDEIWFSFPSKDFTVGGRAYQMPGGAVCFQRDSKGSEALLKFLRSERDFWSSGNQAEWVKRADALRAK